MYGFVALAMTVTESNNVATNTVAAVTVTVPLAVLVSIAGVEGIFDTVVVVSVYC